MAVKANPNANSMSLKANRTDVARKSPAGNSRLGPGIGTPSAVVARPGSYRPQFQGSPVNGRYDEGRMRYSPEFVRDASGNIATDENGMPKMTGLPGSKR